MSEPFYTGGLRFSCQRCSQCCRFEPGYVFLSEEDIDTLSKGLGMRKSGFIGGYCREVVINGNLRLSLKEKPDFDCIFWEDGGCGAYAFRPLQCRSYPFWHSNLASRGSWDTLAESCPGIGRGRLHTGEEIQSWLRKREAERLINRSFA